MTRIYQDQSNSELQDQVNYWSTLPSQNRVDLGWLLESDKVRAFKEFQKFVERVNKFKKKEEPLNNA